MDEQSPVSKTQVIIVGAGPTGLSMATQLLRYHIDFIIIEKNEKTTPLSKAIAVQARTLEIFDELGLSRKAVNEGRVITALNLFYKGKRGTAVNFAGLGEGLSPFPFALSLEQSKTEKLLVDYLSENNKTIRWKSEFSHFEQNQDGVTVYYKDDAGREQKIDAAYLVGCDGASSLVRQQLGLSFEGDTVPKIFYVADVKLNSPVINKDELFVYLIKKGFVIFFPMEGAGHYRLVGILPETSEIHEQFEFTDIEDTIKQQIVSPVDFEELRWFSSYKVHSRKAASFISGRCFIAGDAAHIHTPAGGQGMNTGIQDAYNLAWKLAFTIRKQVNPTVLRTYDEERIENAKHLLQTTDRMFDIFAGTTGFWNFIRLNLLPPIARLVTKSSFIRKRIFPLISQTGISYDRSDLTIDSSIGKVRAGVRMPYFVFSAGKKIFDYLHEPGFKILFFGSDSNNKARELNPSGIELVSCNFNEIPAAIFGKATDFYILLRPDNHISYIGKDLNKCRDFLNKILDKQEKLA